MVVNMPSSRWRLDLAPPFGNKGAPRHVPHLRFVNCFDLNVEEIYKSRRYLIEKNVLLLSISSLAPSLQAPPQLLAGSAPELDLDIRADPDFQRNQDVRSLLSTLSNFSLPDEHNSNSSLQYCRYQWIVSKWHIPFPWGILFNALPYDHIPLVPNLLGRMNFPSDLAFAQNW